MIPIEEATAIERFVINTTLPIIYDRGDVPVLLGTGTLFEIDNRSLIITARHLFDVSGLKLENIAFPETPMKSGLYTLGEFNLIRPDNKEIDIAVLELKSDETIFKLKIGWEFLSLNNVALPSSQGIFFLSGYPDQLTKNVGSWLTGKFATAYTDRIPDVPKDAKKPVNIDLDLFFTYEKEAETLDGKPIKTPELPGTSGASVWEYRESNNTLWTPENSIKVIGVQSAYIHSQYFRAKNWQAVAEVLKKINTGLSEELTSVL